MGNLLNTLVAGVSLWPDDLSSVYPDYGGSGGPASIEAEPGLTNDTEVSVAQAAELDELVDRETPEGSGHV